MSGFFFASWLSTFLALIRRISYVAKLLHTVIGKVYVAILQDKL